MLRGALAHPAAVPALAELSAGPDLLREMREELEAHVLRSLAGSPTSTARCVRRATLT